MTPKQIRHLTAEAEDLERRIKEAQTPGAKLDELAQTYAADHKVEYPVALREVRRRNPDLDREYKQSFPYVPDEE
jgi:hypothetical protein